MLIKQVETFNNYRIDIAKAIVNGIAINVDETLYHYYKHGKNEVKETIDWLRKEVPKRLKKAEDIKMIIRRLKEKYGNVFIVCLDIYYLKIL